MERGDVEELLIELGALTHAPAMVVIDTLARSLVGGEENSAKDVGLFISGADRIRTEFDAAVLIIHHTGKNGDTERGSSALRAAADVMMRLTADDGALTLVCDKMKDALPFDTCYLRLKVTGDGESCIVVMTSGSPVVAGRLTKNHRLVLDAVAGFPDGEASYTRICEASTVALGSFGRLLKGLVAENYVEKSRQKYAVTEKGRSYLTPDLIAITPLSENNLDSSPGSDGSRSITITARRADSESDPSGSFLDGSLPFGSPPVGSFVGGL
jgi:predicted transcriptional regulator